MTRAVLPFVAVLAIVASVPAGAAAEKFGKALQGIEPTTLDKVLAKPEDGQAVRLEGTIDKVCQTKGCWLELKQAERSVHVTFDGYSFFVPKDSGGKKVVLEGKVKVSEPKPEEVEHLQREGAGAAAAAKVSIVASGVEIAAPAAPAK